jgi:hypothetical protein
MNARWGLAWHIISGRPPGPSLPRAHARIASRRPDSPAASPPNYGLRCPQRGPFLCAQVRLRMETSDQAASHSKFQWNAHRGLVWLQPRPPDRAGSQQFSGDRRCDIRSQRYTGDNLARQHSLTQAGALLNSQPPTPDTVLLPVMSQTMVVRQTNSESFPTRC